MNREKTSGREEEIPIMPKHETPGFRLAEHSPDYLSDVELLSLLLKGSAGSDRSLHIARQVIATYGGITSLAKLTFAELKRFPGLGECGAEAIQSALTLARRLQRGNPEKKPGMTNPQTVADYMQPVVGHLLQEEFHALLLSTKHRLIKDCMITRGLVDSTQIHAREIFRPAIQEACSRIILVHNHPSGDPEPSPQDISTTNTLISAGKIVGIDVLDHIIIGKPSQERPFWLSMRENGLFK